MNNEPSHGLTDHLNSMRPDKVREFVSSRVESDLPTPDETVRGQREDFEREYVGNFDEPGPWIEATTEKFHAKVESGQYVFHHFDELTSHTIWVPVAASNEHYWGWEMKINRLEGSYDSEAGLLLGGRRDLATGSYFLINPDAGYYTVADLGPRTNGGIGWIFYGDRKTRSSAIHKRCNRLRAECLDGDLRYFINDSYLGQRRFDGLFGDAFGIVLMGRGGVAVDYMKINW